MAQPYIGEIRIFAGNFAPDGWALCQGQLLPIDQFDALFTLIGTTYGGDGQSTFGLPDLQSRLPVHQGNGFVLGQTGGVEDVTLTVQQMTAHNHALIATTNAGTTTNPPTNLLARGGTAYIQDVGSSPLNAASVSLTGGNQPHTNLQPYLALNFIISLFGIFPSQS